MFLINKMPDPRIKRGAGKSGMTIGFSKPFLIKYKHKKNAGPEGPAVIGKQYRL